MDRDCLMCGGGSFPKQLRYTRSHKWARLEDGIYTIGVTRHAINQIREIILVDLPREGDAFLAQEAFGTIEAAEAYTQLFSPVDGVVIQVNEDLEERPELVADEPYTGGWLIKMTASPAYYGRLLDNRTYIELFDLAA